MNEQLAILGTGGLPAPGHTRYGMSSPGPVATRATTRAGKTSAWRAVHPMHSDRDCSCRSHSGIPEHAGSLGKARVGGDVSQSEALENLADRACDAFGDVQLLINNAALEVLGFTWEIPADTWNKTLGININGVVRGMRAFAPRMLVSTRPPSVAWP